MRPLFLQPLLELGHARLTLVDRGIELRDLGPGGFLGGELGEYPLARLDVAGGLMLVALRFLRSLSEDIHFPSPFWRSYLIRAGIQPAGSSRRRRSGFNNRRRS